MRNRIRHYFIGHFMNTDDVFEVARAIMVYRFSIVFTILFTIPLVSDFAFNMHKAAVLHCIDLFTLFAFPFMMRKLHSLNLAITLFFTVCLISNLVAFMILNPEKIDATALLWSSFFLMIGTLLLRGLSRIIFSAFLMWLPMLYVFLNISMNGALTIHWLAEEKVVAPPIYILCVPVILGIKAIWEHSDTIEEAKKTIYEQKAVIEEKNKTMTDSIHYAKRIQDSLLPSEKAIEKNLDRTKKD